MTPDATRNLIQKLVGIPFGQLEETRLNRRFELFEPWQRIPALNAAIAIAFNLDWELGGTADTATADQAFDPGGGLLLSSPATTPVANENSFVTPHLDTEQTAWATAGLWGTENQVRMSTILRGASIAAVHFRMGLFEDAAQPADLALTGSDDNAAFFLFDEDSAVSATKWLMVTNVAGVDSVVASRVTVEAARDYFMEIRIDAQRQPHFYIDGQLLGTGPVMTDAVDLIPQIAVGSDTTALKTMTTRFVRCSRSIA